MAVSAGFCAGVAAHADAPPAEPVQAKPERTANFEGGAAENAGTASQAISVYVTPAD